MLVTDIVFRSFLKNYYLVTLYYLYFTKFVIDDSTLM